MNEQNLSLKAKQLSNSHDLIYVGDQAAKYAVLCDVRQEADGRLLVEGGKLLEQSQQVLIFIISRMPVANNNQHFISTSFRSVDARC